MGSKSKCAQIARATSLYERVYSVVARIPSGRVATYGQIAAIVGNCSARVIGYALAATPDDRSIPWQRVINSRGEVSIRQDGAASGRQRDLLEAEGVRFDAKGRVDFSVAAWDGPDWHWLQENGFHVAPPAGFERRK